jgi:hypothetical protein
LHRVVDGQWNIAGKKTLRYWKWDPITVQLAGLIPELGDIANEQQQ